MVLAARRGPVGRSCPTAGFAAAAASEAVSVKIRLAAPSQRRHRIVFTLLGFVRLDPSAAMEFCMA